MGEDAGTEDDYAVEQPDRDFPLHGLGVPSAPMNGCIVDGMPSDCETAVELVQAGGARMYFTYDPLPASPFFVNHENGHGGYRRWVTADPHRDRGAHWEFATLEAFGGFGPVGVRDPQDTPRRTPDACGDMAEIAQLEADQVLATLSAGAYAGVQSAAIRQELQAAVRRFDDAFSERYTGRAMRTMDDINFLYETGGGARTITQYYLGETGFRTEFKEAGPRAGLWNDQTHHFAAMFSGGINKAHWTTTYHNIFDNAGDRNLTNAAYDLGVKFSQDPIHMLKNIGKIIREKICDPNRNPKH